MSKDVKKIIIFRIILMHAITYTKLHRNAYCTYFLFLY